MVQGFLQLWQAGVERLPDGIGMLCAVLSGVIPLTVYWVNNKLHQWGDPPWKGQKKSAFSGKREKGDEGEPL